MPQEQLLALLSGITNNVKPNETPGMDCALVATRHPGLFLISTTDFFFPNVEHPFTQGRIAAANVLSDLYANGVVEVDTVLMLLAVSLDMEAPARDVVARELIRGFTAAVAAAGASVTGGQTVKNPWPIIGGVASATVREGELVRPGRAARAKARSSASAAWAASTRTRVTMSWCMPLPRSSRRRRTLSHASR